METVKGKAYVLGDNVDTDQIIPAEYLSYNPSIPEDRKYFGRFALSGVPIEQAGLPEGGRAFVDLSNEDNCSSEYRIVIGGKNFGCGSSREHAPLALAEAGVKAVVAEFYARIFFRNSVNGAYVVPVECESRLVDKISTGDELEIDFDNCVLRNLTTSEEHALNPLGDVAEIVEAGGLFNYARDKNLV